MVVGDSPVTLIATITPADAANQALTWGSDNEAVATVSGGTVTPVGAGTATITVTTVDGGHTATSAAAHRGAPSPVHRHCSVVPVSHFPIPPSLQSMKKRDSLLMESSTSWRGDITVPLWAGQRRTRWR